MLVPAGSRYCHRCSTLKELASFPKRASDPEGRDSTCRTCSNAAAKQRREIKARLMEAVRNGMHRPARHLPLPEGVEMETYQ
ncbi:MAG: hypothetical protein KGL48_16245 [Sphingomonadales bacterium]|nr:hypothetical protein [Sphingomonadales bacterium]